MAAIGNDPQVPSTTEDAPSAPGWVEQSLDEILSMLPQRPTLTGLRNAYLDCIAGVRGPNDLDTAHDRCRMVLLRSLGEQEQVGASALATIERKLEAMEAEITEQL